MQLAGSFLSGRAQARNFCSWGLTSSSEFASSKIQPNSMTSAESFVTYTPCSSHVVATWITTYLSTLGGGLCWEAMTAETNRVREKRREPRGDGIGAGKVGLERWRQVSVEGLETAWLSGMAQWTHLFSGVWGSAQVSHRRCNEDGWVLSGKCIGRSTGKQTGNRATSLPSQRRARDCGAWWTGAVGEAGSPVSSSLQSPGQVRARITHRLTSTTAPEAPIVRGGRPKIKKNTPQHRKCSNQSRPNAISLCVLRRCDPLDLEELGVRRAKGWSRKGEEEDRGPAEVGFGLARKKDAWPSRVEAGGSTVHWGPCPGSSLQRVAPAEPLEARVLTDSIVTTFTSRRAPRLLGPLSSGVLRPSRRELSVPKPPDVQYLTTSIKINIGCPMMPAGRNRERWRATLPLFGRRGSRWCP